MLFDLGNSATRPLPNAKHEENGMVLIPGGEYSRGCDTGSEFEQPVRSIQISSFYIDATPVTNLQFRQFCDATGYKTTAELLGNSWGFADGEYQFVNNLSWSSYALRERENHPVVQVSWNDALAFAQWAGKRLPTEAEWEYAARGNRESAFPWGDAIPDGTQSNFAKYPTEVPPTTAVRQFSANAFGLYDMVGNVWQWCADWYGPDYYRTGETIDPQGPKCGTHKVRRGGSWNVIQAFRLRNANRGAAEPEQAVPNVGFRCAKNV